MRASPGETATEGSIKGKVAGGEQVEARIEVCRRLQGETGPEGSEGGGALRKCANRLCHVYPLSPRVGNALRIRV